MTELVVLICRSGDEPLAAGARAGYQCAACRQRLQVSASGLKRMEYDPDITLLCNHCGAAYAEFVDKLGIADFETSEHARESLASGRATGPMAEFIRRMGMDKK